MLSLGGYVSSLIGLPLRTQADKFASDIDEHDRLAASQPVIENR